MLLRCLFFIVLATGALTAVAQEAATPAITAVQLETRRAAIAEEEAAIERVREELRALGADLQRLTEAAPDGGLSEDMVKQAEVDREAARLRRDDLAAEITATDNRILELERLIRELESREQLLRNPAKDQAEGANRVQQLQAVQETLALRRDELALERRHLANVRTRLLLADQRLDLLGQRQDRLRTLYQQQQEQSRREAQESLTERLQRQARQYQEQAAILTERLARERDSLSEVERYRLETQAQIAEDRARLNQLDIRLAAITRTLADTDSLLEQPDVPPRELLRTLTGMDALGRELGKSKELLAQRSELYDQQQQVLAQRDASTRRSLRVEAEQLAALSTDLGERLTDVQRQMTLAQALSIRLDRRYSQQLSRNLLTRMQVPTSSTGWQALLKDLANAPQVLLYQVRLSVESLLKRTLEAEPWRWSAIGLVALLLAFLLQRGWRRLEKLIERTRARLAIDNTFVGNALLICLILLRMNLIGAVVAAALLAWVGLVQVPQPGLAIIITLVLLWLGIKVPINLAWLLLASSYLAEDYRRPALYRQLLQVLFLGGLLGASMILARLSLLPEPVIQFVDWVFMLYLLMAFWPVLKLRRYIVWLLEDRFAKRVWFITLSLVSLLLPLALLGAALIGLLGYLNLAWAVAWHLVVLVAVLIGWLMLRGLLNDVAIWLKNYAVLHSSLGLLWTQDVINPLHRLLRLLLFAGAWLVLVTLYGLDRESLLVTTAWAFLGQPLFALGEAEITLWNVLVTGFALLLVFWFAQWMRALAFRWLLSPIGDLGVRHSLSVFIQYAIVLIGLLVVLRSIGLDLTTLTVFAGALGVGLGFGLQAIFNNFVSGLILLVERPLRSGDTVQIGTHTGEVTRIGIRSLTIKTWDSTDVILPNSDIITQPFTNWTHSDDVVRTVLMINVARDTDPRLAQQLMEAAVLAEPDILAEPEPLVLLWEFGNSALVFRVQYFTDFQRSNLLKVRSALMFAIHDRFRAAGIEIYFLHQALHVKEWPEGVRLLPRPTPEADPPSARLDKASPERGNPAPARGTS